MEEQTADAVEVAASSPEKVEALGVVAEMMNNTIYLMGFSFILGVVFTIFILIVFDFMRRNKQEGE